MPDTQTRPAPPPEPAPAQRPVIPLTPEILAFIRAQKPTGEGEHFLVRHFLQNTPRT